MNKCLLIMDLIMLIQCAALTYIEWEISEAPLNEDWQ